MTRVQCAAAVLALVLTGCGGSPASSPQAPPSTGSVGTASPQPSVASVPVTTSVTPVPSPTPLVDLGLGPAQVARVVVDDLAVRRAPSIAAPLVDGWLFHEELGNWEKVTSDLRFDAGHYVYLYQGPLVIDGRPWFLIDDLPQPGDGDYSEVLRWDVRPDPDDGWDGWGWIAAADGGERLLGDGTDYEFPVGEVTSFPYEEPLVRAYGIGDGESPPWQADGPFSPGYFYGVFRAAADPEGASCDIGITLQPEGEAIEEDTVTGAAHSAGWWSTAVPATPGEHWLDVSSDCSWSLTVMLVTDALESEVPPG